ncbi:MAG: InlB B-repeat-containing protein [Acetatifactor sp.]|nr:InlB B-repeat-containing protein [Acetatifactor sp.]
MNKILKRIVTTTLFVVMFTLAFKSTTPVQAATSTVTITYQANGGTVYATGPEGTKQTVKYNTSVRLAPPSIARNGYVLLGFDKDKNAPYPRYLLNNQYKFKSNVTLYAIWAKRSEIYDRFGDSFSYDVDFSKIASKLEMFRVKSWIGQPEDVRIEKVKDLAARIARLYGLSRVPNIVKGLPENCNPKHTLGVYKNGENTVYINPGLYNDVFRLGRNYVAAGPMIAKTVAHELRHAYQYQRARNPQCRMDFLYGYNLGIYGYGGYVKCKEDANGDVINYSEYQDQLVEAEAFGIETLVDFFLK